MVACARPRVLVVRTAQRPPEHRHPPSQLESSIVKSAVETLEPTKVKLTVEVTYDELKPNI
ncbi:MAG TPA: hypothetical protein VGK17_07080, partial [Propionicimonas sp.]